jgi:FkbM family methyltransferase
MTKELRDSVRKTRALKLAAMGRIVVNKATYVLVRALASTPPDGWLHSPWHWYRFPFSLRNHFLWSPSLQCWFWPEDESAIECMLHLPNYEPVEWVAPRPGDIFLDVGGYTGWYSIQAARAVQSSGRVLAFEPDSVNRGQLERNLVLNNIQNTQVLPLAVWSRTCCVGWEKEDQPVWHHVGRLEEGNARQAISIDDLVAQFNLPRVDWIKLDIEGAEIAALHGATRTLMTFHPKLFIEVHLTKATVLGILQKIGYKVEREKYDVPPDHHGWILAAV